MCGIIARVGDGTAMNALIDGLENLEYRGYDSAGVAVQNGSGVKVHKCSGEVSELKDRLDTTPAGNVGIGHTRWSTHGPPTDENAHPHTDSAGDVAVVHNGIIENYEALRRELEAEGREFTSDTDTEVVPHLIDRHLETAATPEAAFRAAVAELDGSYAIAALIDGEDAVYATREGSPLVLGLEDDGWYLASDVPAFLDHTNEVVYLEDDDVVVIEPQDVTITDADGERVEREVKSVDWSPEETTKGQYDHYMLKEIHSQPTALTNTTEGRVGDDGIDLSEFPPGTFTGVTGVQLVACGTSYHAALCGKRLLADAGVRVRAARASEYAPAGGSVGDDTLVVAVTQSGETADTLAALRAAKAAGARTVAVTNVVGSTAAREADEALYIRAGPEIGVAATKTFSSQAVALTLLGHRIAADAPDGTASATPSTLLDALDSLPNDVQSVLDGTDAERVAARYADSDAYFFIGRGLGYPVALEGALKFKEITYEHAEGFAAGELKHGPLALVTPRTPVFAVFTGADDDKTLTNAEEARTRGAPVVAVAPADHPAAESADAHLEIPDTHPALAGLLANVQLQLLSYHAADNLGRPIDKPRNLAKSVTVE